jgi:hypothetical protein
MKIFVLVISLLVLLSCGKKESKTIYVDNAHNDQLTGFLSWDDSRFPIVVKVPTSISSDALLMDAINNAADRWNNALQDAVSGDVIQIEIANISNSQHSLVETYLQDNVSSFIKKINDWFDLNKDGTVSSSENQTLAITAYAYDSASLKLQKADFLFNYKIFGSRFADISTNPGSTKIDLESVITHEMGHFLGLQHIDPSVDASSIMNPSLAANTVKRNLSAADQCRVNENYGFLFPCDEATLKNKFCYNTDNMAGNPQVKNGKCQIIECVSGFKVNDKGSACVSDN